jgi:hypothetical protein
MSIAPADYERLLREAVHKAREAAPRAVDDLIRCASGAAEAVAVVTRDAAILELVPLNEGKDSTPTYQLQLRKVGSEAPPSDLGIYRVTKTGYPVLRWFTRAKWERSPDKPDRQFSNLNELEDNFKWMVSQPESKLVVLVTFFQQEQPASAEQAPPGKKPKRPK